MADKFQEIAERFAAIAKTVATQANPIRLATVIGVNPDGSVRVDTGDGGCANVASVGNQVVTCGATVVLGLEPNIGNTTDLCQVQFTINSSSKGCPIETRIDDNEEEAAVGYIFVDDNGYGYDYSTGAYLGDGFTPTDGDISYGYSYDPDPYPATTPTLNRAGALDDDGLLLYLAPNYDDVVIGNYALAPNNSGYQGSNYANTGGIHQGRLVRGLGSSTDRLLGMEIVNDAAGDHGPNWTVVIRQLSDYSILATNAASYLSAWVTSFMYDDAVTFAPSVSADPDGSFWITIQNGRIDGNNFPNPMFNVSPTDGSLIRTVELATPATGTFYHAAPVAI